MYSLWRNGELLARLSRQGPVNDKDGKIAGVHGVLEPTSAFTGMIPMVQSSIPLVPGAPTFQHPLEPTVLGQIPQKPSNRGPVELEPLSDDEARGVPHALLLELQSDDGTPVAISFFHLACWIIPDDMDPAEVRRLLGESSDAREIWTLMASFTKLT